MANRAVACLALACTVAIGPRVALVNFTQIADGAPAASVPLTSALWAGTNAPHQFPPPRRVTRLLPLMWRLDRRRLDIFDGHSTEGVLPFTW